MYMHQEWVYLVWLINAQGETNEFTFTVGEQEFYAEKGLVNKPKRCPECRKTRRMNQRAKRKLYDVTCSDCGCQTQVPFKPISGKEVYCKECYAKHHE